jgi:UDPglucose 6-dehydrogenase
MPAQYRIGILGCGFVGTAVGTGFETLLKEKVVIKEYDKYKDTESINSVVNSSDILFFCLPTPMNEDGSCNISILEEVAKEVNKIARKRKICVIKSTVPPGTTQNFENKYPGHFWIFNPEFLTEKNFISDFLSQDRIILGLAKKSNHLLVRQSLHPLYIDFIKHQIHPGTVYETASEEAEMLKYVTNSFLATKVSFFNEMHQICNALGVNYTAVISLLSEDKRIGSTHMQVPGPDGLHGFGGACLSKDINSLMAIAKEVDVDPMVLESVWTKNLFVREKYDWESLAQVTGDYKKNEG